MKHLFIINPVSGKKQDPAALSERISGICTERGLDFEIYITRCPMDAAEKVRSYPAGPLRVYACGGDGTLNEVVCGAAGRPDVSVTHYPIGTGNDFIRAFGAGDAALFSDMEGLISGQPLPLDLIDCNGRMSINICSVGIDARVARDVHRIGSALGLRGRAAYNLSLAVNLVRGINSRMTVRVNGDELNGSFALVAACSGRYYGGGFNPAPEAEPDDGRLDFLVVRGMSLFKAADLVGRYSKGRYKEIPQYIRYYSGDCLEVESKSPLCVNIDGECGEASTVRFRIIPAGISFIFPADSDFYRSKKGENAAKAELNRDLSE